MKIDKQINDMSFQNIPRSESPDNLVKEKVNKGSCNLEKKDTEKIMVKKIRQF